MENHISLIEEMPFFETFQGKGKAVINTEVFEKWLNNLRNIKTDKKEESDIFEYKIKILKQAMKDGLFTDDLKEISSDFQNVDLQGW